jgi:hypothetical protein
MVVLPGWVGLKWGAVSDRATHPSVGKVDLAELGNPRDFRPDGPHRSMTLCVVAKQTQKVGGSREWKF